MESLHQPPSLSLPHKGGGENSPLAYSSIQEAFIQAVRILSEAGLDTPELDARLLLCHAAGLSHEACIARAHDLLAPDAALSLQAFVQRRACREPVSRITGTREFYGRRFEVDANTLDPRPDTETLIEAALDIAATKGWTGESLELLDLGTGTGCILITLLAELPRARGLGTDVSEAALNLAAVNAERCGVAARAAFLRSDWLDAVAGRFDLIVSNPPYIPAGEIESLADDVALYDPLLALDGGPDGLEAYRRIASRAARLLAADGILIVEIGAGQADAVAGIFGAAGLRLAEDRPVRRDLAGRPRAVLMRH
jgi:release factor glutamine methyltransferase